jgi:hypothetical protein
MGNINYFLQGKKIRKKHCVKGRPGKGGPELARAL